MTYTTIGLSPQVKFRLDEIRKFGDKPSSYNKLIDEMITFICEQEKIVLPDYKPEQTSEGVK